MRSQDSAAGKMNEQPFAARLDLIDRLANERRIVVESNEERERRPEADDRLAHERAADVARGAKDGVAFRHSLLIHFSMHFGPVRLGMRDGERNAAQMHSQRPRMKASVHKKARHWVRGDRLAVNGCDQHAFVIARAHSLLPAPAEKMRQSGGGLRALRLVSRQKDQQIRIAALEPRHKLAVAQNYFGISSASENARRGFLILFGDRQIRPAQNRSIGVGWIGRGQLYKLRLLRGRLGAQLA